METGLDYRGARFYDSDVARFLSLDPAATEYPSLSDYCYVGGNPIIFIDPSGRNTEYYDIDGNHVHSSKDDLPNSVVTLSASGLTFFNELKSWADYYGWDTDGVIFNTTARFGGKNYDVDAFIEFKKSGHETTKESEFLNPNNKIHPLLLRKEHGASLVDNGGFITIDYETASYGDATRMTVNASNNPNATGTTIHTHDNEGTRFYSNRKRVLATIETDEYGGPSPTDWTNTPGHSVITRSPSISQLQKINSYFEIVVSDTHINFYRHQVNYSVDKHYNTPINADTDKAYFKVPIKSFK